MRILVTGATGFLGQNLCPALEAAGHEVVRVGSRDADLREKGSLDRFAGPFDRIWHLAAWTQAGDFCLKHPGEQWVINQLINTNVLEWWQRAQPQAKLVAMGTSCSYAPGEKLSEDRYLEGQPIESLFAYAMTKRMLYAGLLALRKQFGLRFLHLVPSTLYGPDYHTDGRQLHFIFDLIRKIIRGKRLGEPVVLWGDGHQRRELVYVGDFVKFALALDAAGVEGETVNIGAGEEFSIRHFAALICGFVGYPFERVQFDTSRYVGATSKCLDVAKLLRLLPGASYTPLDEGLGAAVAWMARQEDAGPCGN